MSVRTEQNKLRAIVQSVLLTDEDTRNCNERLVVAVYNIILAERGTTLQGKEFINIMLNRKQMGLPSFESVTRCRRKLQEEDPSLRSDDNIQAMREIREYEFKEWAVDKQGQFCINF